MKLGDDTEPQIVFQQEHFRYGDFADLDAKAIELPYKDSDMSLFVILPNSRTGLSQLESQLKNVEIRELSKRMFKTEVDVSLPKFKIEFEVSLVDTLKKVNGNGNTPTKIFISAGKAPVAAQYNFASVK